MIVRAPRPEANFYVLSKAISEDKRLSWAARGLLVFLLGKPDHWQVSPSAIVNETATAGKRSGRDAVYALLQELHAVGYITRTQSRGDDGSMGTVFYTVSETPRRKNPDTAPRPALPHTANPPAPRPALPHTANPPQVKTEEKQEQKNDENAGAQPRVTFDLEAGIFQGIEGGLFARLEGAFPATDVRAELRRAALWLTANPKNRKSNYLRFLSNWLLRAQDRAPATTTTTGGTYARPRTIHDKRDDWTEAMFGAARRARAEPVADAQFVVAD